MVVAFSNLPMQQADLNQVGAKKREEYETGKRNDDWYDWSLAVRRNARLWDGTRLGFSDGANQFLMSKPHAAETRKRLAANVR